MPAPIQDALWRVGREAILNVVKHARARQVALHVFCKDGAVYLSVGDDGVGFRTWPRGRRGWKWTGIMACGGCASGWWRWAGS